MFSNLSESCSICVEFLHYVCANILKNFFLRMDCTNSQQNLAGYFKEALSCISVLIHALCSEISGFVFLFFFFLIKFAKWPSSSEPEFCAIRI